MIKVIKGNIFDSTCDLLIIPCSHGGYVTSSIARELYRYSIPKPFGLTKAGEVRFTSKTGLFDNAMEIGYAASVDDDENHSTPEIIRDILTRIKDHCRTKIAQRKDSPYTISLPLLGTGAGGVPSKTAFSIIKEVFASQEDMTVWVHAFSDRVYQTIQEENTSPEEIHTPVVFISYSRTNQDNVQWVRELACKLRANGVDAHLDQFRLKAGENLPQWMCSEILKADKVLLICDQSYIEKADSRQYGVGWENMIIQGDMLMHQNSIKYIAILREKELEDKLPPPLKANYALGWANPEREEEWFKELLFHLFECSREPALGKIPKYIREGLHQGKELSTPHITSDGKEEA